jgi:hypothetical protein
VRPWCFAAKAQAAGGVESALARLLVLPENYPQLQSSDSFLKLQDQLGGPFFSSLAGVQPAEYFEIAEAAREVRRVDFRTRSNSKTESRRHRRTEFIPFVPRETQ